jgi:hypothetical protein
MRRKVARKGKETTVFYQERLGLLLEEISEVIETAANDLNMSYPKVEQGFLALKNINTKTRAPSAWNRCIASMAEELREGKVLAFQLFDTSVNTT